VGIHYRVVSPSWKSHHRERYLVDDLTIDIGAVAVWRGPEQLTVPDLSFSTLACLVRRAPDVVSPENLVQEVWEGMAVSDENITQRIALLRRALGDDSREPRYIRSVRGRGYQLIPRPERLEDDTPQPATAPADKPGHSRRLLGGLLTGVVLALAVLALLRGNQKPDLDQLAETRSEVSSSDFVQRARRYFDLHRAEDNERAIELFQQALEENPDDPAALAGLALAFAQRSAKFNQPVTWAHEGEQFARRAVEIEPEFAEAHHALGLTLDAQGELTRALASYRRAAELEPGHVRAIGSGAYVLFVKGELAEALRWNLRLLPEVANLHYQEIQIAETLAALDFAPAAEAWYEKATTLRPDNLFAARAYAGYLLGRGDLAAAEELITHALEVGIERPELYELRGHLSAMQGDVDAAQEFYRQAVEMTPRSPAALRLLALEEAGPQTLEAIETLNSGQESGDQWPPEGIDLAVLNTAMSHYSAAIAAIHRSIDLGYRNSAWLLVDPALAPLREQEEFWTEIERIRELVADERETVLSSGWLPEGFLDAGRKPPD